ncbi:MAG: radical SAM protein [Clostridiales bacterium]|nr:radical SAM protein [Clostridiales bacterium]
MIGYISSYESFATMEGPGIRFAVFMAGCNLRCAYCHNPDTWTDGHKIDSNELYNHIIRYKPYFKNGGGVTFTGGEPILQAKYLTDVSRKLIADGINIAVDTSLSVLSDEQKEFYTLCNLVIADLKFTTGKNYEKYCKKDIFSTAKDTLNFLQEKNIAVWIRTVIIPGVNDTKEDIKNYYDVIKGYKNIERFELKPFHTMGFEKYEKLNLANPFYNKADMSQDKMEILQNYLNELVKS